MKKTIYDLKLHESLLIDKFILVTRVPGGWIYILFGSVEDGIDKDPMSTFVPYSNEFKPMRPTHTSELPNNEVDETTYDREILH